MTLPTLDPIICVEWSKALIHTLWQGPILLLATIFIRQFRPQSSIYQYYVLIVALLALFLCIPLNYFIADQLPEISLLSQSTELPTDPTVQLGPARDATDEDDGLLLPIAGSYQKFLQSPASFVPYIVICYFLGAAAMLFRLTCGILGGQFLVRTSQPISDSQVMRAIVNAVQRMGFSYSPASAYCNSVVVPCVVGVLRPMLLLPFTVIGGLTPLELETLVMHELAHIRRHDHLINLLQRILEAFLFYHPVAWILGRQIRHEREKCCDDWVVDAGGDRALYARALVRMAELSIAEPSISVPLVALAATGDISQLRRRVMRILGQDSGGTVRLKRPAAFIITFMAVVFLMVPLAFSMRVGPQSQDEIELRLLRNELKRNPSVANAKAGSWSLLHIAAAYRPIEEVRLLLESGADPNVRHPAGSTPLLVATAAGRHDVVDLLSHYKADVNVRNRDGRSPLLVAARKDRGDAGRMVRLLSALGADVNAAGEKGGTPLFAAVQSGQYSVVEYLIGRDANLEDLRTNGRTPLFAACAAADLKMIELLIAHGANATVKDKSGWSTVDVLVLRIRSSLVDSKALSESARILIEAGAEVSFNAAIVLGMTEFVQRALKEQPSLVTRRDLRTVQGRTPLHWAAAAGNLELCEILVASGANINALTHFGRTALHLACLQHFPGNSVAKLLLDLKIELDTRDDDGMTALHLAVTQADEELANSIIQAGAQINVSNHQGQTPLHLAAMTSNEQLVDLLLKKGTSPNIQDRSGHTPLHSAVVTPVVNKRVIRRLIEFGADLSIRDKDGKIPGQLVTDPQILQELQNRTIISPSSK